ncbi:alpha/beta fold hydrolase [Clostridium minihomine]|uniref:alpha/beta fold hydrolase n=1 Tax=Clostridium minihomine TaxID=2045012 RepID=UPI0013ECC2BE|nr:alpha/beta hydrolase [Clostridium minihomine]
MSKQICMLENNRQLSYQTYGNGSNTLLFFHGLAGSSWLGQEWISAIEKADVRCIIIERIGYGESTPIPMNSVSEWIPLVQQAASQLQLNSFQVVGCSAGAPYAYATALALPQATQKIWILGGVPAVYEDSIFRHYSEEAQTAYQNYVVEPVSTIQEQYTAQLTAALQQADETVPRHVIQTLQEIIDQNCFGMSQESKLQRLPWKLNLSAIHQPVSLHHAVLDEMVPFHAAKEMPTLLSNAVFQEIDTTDLIPEASLHIQSIFKAFLELLKELS